MKGMREKEKYERKKRKGEDKEVGKEYEKE